MGIWNNLETRFTANKVLSLVQADLKLHTGASQAPRESPRNHNHISSFWTTHDQANRFRQCFICGDCSKDHTSCNCSATWNTSGSFCHLFKQGPSNKQQAKSGNPTVLPGMAYQVASNPHARKANTGAPYAAPDPITPSNALSSHDLFVINTPFILDAWHMLLQNTISYINF